MSSLDKLAIRGMCVVNSLLALSFTYRKLTLPFALQPVV